MPTAAKFEEECRLMVSMFNSLDKFSCLLYFILIDSVNKYYLKRNNCVNFTVKIYCKIKMQLYKVRQRLGAVPPDPHILDLQPVETPFKKSWVRPCCVIVNKRM